MSVRTYNPSVRVGNWNEDIQLEEDTLKDFLAKRERGELLIQRTSSLRESVNKQVELSTSRDGTVKFGDIVELINPGSKDGRRGEKSISMLLTESAIYGNDTSAPCGASASGSIEPSARNTFVITSTDGSPTGATLKYGQPFSLCLSGSQLFLHSDRATFAKAAKKSRHQEVSLIPQQSHLTEWKVLPFDPQFRFELEFTSVPANMKVIIVHAKTNQALCVEAEHTLKTPFGIENELTAYTDLDSHKAEKDVNHFKLMMNQPGISPPASQ